MRLATWNINGLRARLPYLLLWLEARQPDVVGLQELKVSDDQFPLIELQAAGYHVVMHGQKSWNGVAILSRQEALVTAKGLPGHESAGARLISARIGDLHFTTVYVPNGKNTSHEDFPKKLRWLDGLAGYLEETVDPESAAVLCGDFNIVPAPIDSWNEAALAGRIFHTGAERERFGHLLGLGLVDVYRERHPETPGFTWWDYRGGALHKRQGLRIDALLVTRPLAERAVEVVPEREWRKKKDGLTPSDHAPVILDIS